MGVGPSRGPPAAASMSAIVVVVVVVLFFLRSRTELFLSLLIF